MNEFVSAVWSNTTVTWLYADGNITTKRNQFNWDKYFPRGSTNWQLGRLSRFPSCCVFLYSYLGLGSTEVQKAQFVCCPMHQIIFKFLKPKKHYRCRKCAWQQYGKAPCNICG
jgi:hypothetical protein